MAETFERFAQRMADALYVTDAEGTRPRDDIDTVTMTREWYVDQLRAAWNARGHADADAAVTRLSTLVGWVSSEPYLHHIREAIAALDR